jgi:hypothetical protein
MALGRTARFYRKNRASYLKKLAKANSHPVWGEQTKERKDARVKDARMRRKEARRRKKNGQPKLKKDEHYDRSTGKFVPAKENLSRKEKSRKKNSKRNKRMFGKAVKGACK